MQKKVEKVKAKETEKDVGSGAEITINTEELLLRIYSQADQLFDAVKKQLFVEEWLGEKTELIFACHAWEDGRDEMVFCKGNPGGEYRRKEYPAKPEESPGKTVERYIRETCGEKKYQKSTLLRWVTGKTGMEVSCICISPCFDRNNGKMLLEQTFRTMIGYLGDWMERLGRMGWEEDGNWKIDNFHHFVQCILQEAARKTCEYLEGFYFPIKISYINSLAGEYYEKAECQSDLLFLSDAGGNGVDGKELKYDFRENTGRSNIKFVPENIRWIRKLSQMAQSPLCLMFKNDADRQVYEVIGIGRNPHKKDRPDAEDGGSMEQGEITVPHFWAEIKKHMQWDLHLGTAYIFSFRNGNYKITMGMPGDYLKEKCRAVFGRSGEYGDVTSCILTSQEQAHGTMLVVLSGRHAKEEVERLSRVKAGMQDANPSVRVDVINKLNAIDGSVIMGTDGIVYGIGMILDGDSSAEGNPARGARYNSAKKYRKYLESRKMPGLIFIVSEDGSVEILTSMETSGQA